MKTKEEVLGWLRDAHAMEKGMAVMLKKQCENRDAPMRLREMAARHLSETEHHAERLERCLHRLGTDTSLLKSAAAQGLEWLKGLGTSLSGDEVIKDLLAACAAEHLEIACYTALKAAGQELELQEVIDTAHDILREEVKMAAWIDNHLPDLIREHLRGSSHGGRVDEPAGGGLEANASATLIFS